MKWQLWRRLNVAWMSETLKWQLWRRLNVAWKSETLKWQQKICACPNSTGLRNPSSNHFHWCHSHRFRKPVKANKQFFDDAQRTTQIISDVCFITDHVAYTSTNQTQIVWIETELTGLRHPSFWRKVPESDARSVISTQTFRRALTSSTDRCAEISSAPSVA